MLLLFPPAPELDEDDEALEEDADEAELDELPFGELPFDDPSLEPPLLLLVALEPDDEEDLLSVR